MELQVGDLVLCTVKDVERTTVFVKISFDNREIDGSINFSEVAPGRIRNIRDYVVPNKKIVCKVLRITQTGNIELSLRRVSLKETKEVMSKNSQERSYTSMIKSLSGNKAEQIIKDINKEERLYDFFQEAKENSKKLEKFFGKAESQKIQEVLNSQKLKKVVLKREIELKSTKPDGVEIIKDILGNVKDCDVIYIAAGKYLLRKESGDIKNADKKLREILLEVEKGAKKLGAEFKLKEQ